MAEFCLDCWNEISNMSLTEEDVIISKEIYLCEGCAEHKKIIVIYDRSSKMKRFFRKVFFRF